ncbi:hypothetical protein SAMN05444410_1263 [Hydrobacter penzbergensis]|uniref:Uncharacterized protein n=1 Tax=Hydrobacter penzbergensis TaxID=1235997 RepID=A0A8X8IG72_9BACT|nr:hypothetical protein [Hydrobacter penzbergensis]SDX68546.1 hypothetical protein SAMN05444410_1263 [Hydrobacter penzbergensis]
MNQQDNNTSAAFMEVTSRKMEGLDKKIDALEGKLKEIPAHAEPLNKLLDSMERLRSDISEASVLPEKLAHFSKRLELVAEALKQQPTSKVIHQHHVPKLIWISAGLFVGICLVCSGWYVTTSKLNSFIANDTKYRQMRLDTTHKSLQLYLDRLDSLYETYPNMREKVLETEEEHRLNFERLQKAERLRTEAKNLEKSAGRK